MEESDSKKEEMREIISSENRKERVVDISIGHDPCSLFQEAIKAFLKCLGFQEDPSSSTPATQDDPPTSTSQVKGAITWRAKNRRPPIKRGPPPQNN